MPVRQRAVKVLVVVTATSAQKTIAKNTVLNRVSEEYSSSQYSESESEHIEEKLHIISKQFAHNEQNKQPYRSPMRRRVRHRPADVVTSKPITMKNQFGVLINEPLTL